LGASIPAPDQPVIANVHTMAKEKEIEVKEEAKVLSPREVAWEAYLVAYEKKNPAKFAVKKARGEFDKVPVSFVIS
jgi:hypothetical protein